MFPFMPFVVYFLFIVIDYNAETSNVKVAADDKVGRFLSTVYNAVTSNQSC